MPGFFCNKVYSFIIYYSMNEVAQFFSENFQNCIWLAILLIAMCPALESKIAIPLAMNTAIWGSGAFSPLLACLVSFIGSIIPSYLIIFLTRKLKKKTAFMLHSPFFQKYLIKGARIENRGSDFKKYLALACFVAIPIPLTGVWTGSLISGLSNLNIHWAFLSICIGALFSTGIITILCTFFSNSLTMIMMVTLIIIIVFMISEFIISSLNRKKNQGN